MQLVGIFLPDILVFGAAGRVTPNLVATVGIEAWRFFCRQAKSRFFVRNRQQ
jgi:hypothetical protein